MTGLIDIARSSEANKNEIIEKISDFEKISFIIVIGDVI